MSANDTWKGLDAGRRRRSDGCVSDLVLDRLALGELDATERPAVEAHLGTCTDCATASARLAEDRAGFAREAAVANLAADALVRSEKKEDADWRGLWRRFFFPLGAIAAAVVVMVVTAEL